MSDNELSLEFITGVAYPTPFDRYTVALCESAMRHLAIQRPQLDHAAFDNSALVDAISALARRSR